VRDQEFISGELDTGFISRFNQRRVPLERSEQDRDLAVIAAALHYVKNRQQPVRVANSLSKWKLSGREFKSNHRG
jgi:hypothetical protein